MQERSEIKEKDKWLVESIYENDDLWNKDYNLVKSNISTIEDFKGIVTSSPDTLLVLLDVYSDLKSKIEKLFTYANMKKDEDIENNIYQNQYELAYSLIVDFDELSSFIKPEIISLTEDNFEVLLKTCKLRPYFFYLKNIYRFKNFTLSEECEKLISMSLSISNNGYNIFNSFNNGDIKFETIKDSQEKEVSLTHGSYFKILIDKDRDIRRQGFIKYHKSYAEYPNMLATTLNSQIKTNLFHSKARGYNSTLESSLFQNNIPVSIYTNLIETVRKNIGVLHNYLDYRRDKMGLDRLHPYDLYVPIFEYNNNYTDYDEARKMVIESVSILGNEYSDSLKKGLYDDRWVDIYENKNKRSGAYSTGSFLTKPFILMNYNGTMNDIKTLAHEAGHSMHSFYSRKSQPAQYADYSIFLAEVASTFNEELLSDYLQLRSEDIQYKRFLINQRLEEIRATFFRQTMFAEFELIINNFVAEGIPLTYNLLNNEYRKLNSFYLGSNVELDEMLDIEWARIPHFYYNYYVYQYATGISAAIALFRRAMSDKSNIEKYINFLKSGSSSYPIDILKNAGVDMTSPEPIKETIKYFQNLVDDLIKLG